MSFGLYDVPGFIIKGCSDIFIPIIKFIFKIIFSQRNFPILSKPIYLFLFLKNEIVPQQLYFYETILKCFYLFII
jgi:hypothetical protein